jgi:hypothetical protein
MLFASEKRYQSGRSGHWLKVKNPDSPQCGGIGKADVTKADVTGSQATQTTIGSPSARGMGARNNATRFPRPSHCG